jgi:hypothetical protein
MWLAQFVCAPHFFKTLSGLCGHTEHYKKRKLMNRAANVIRLLADGRAEESKEMSNTE